MFTFRRETGFLLNNGTSESWIWREWEFKKTLLSPKYDLEAGDMPGGLVWAVIVLCLVKPVRLLASIFGFMIISFVNGLVVRIALLCSNVVIFPLIWCFKVFQSRG